LTSSIRRAGLPKNGASKGFFRRKTAFSRSQSALPGATSLATPCIEMRAI